MTFNQIEAGTQLWLVRHGETEWNRDGRVQGHLDVPLSERGIEQARTLARWLAEEPIAAVYTSDLQRARHTAEIIAGGRLPLHVEARFREAAFGEFQGLTGAEAEARFPGAYAAWRRDAVRNRPPGGETLEDLLARCVAAAGEILPRHQGQTIVVVAHGGPIRATVCGVLGFSLEVYPKLRVENTSIARIAFTRNGPVLAGLNDTGHLQATSRLAAADWEEK